MDERSYDNFFLKKCKWLLLVPIACRVAFYLFMLCNKNIETIEHSLELDNDDDLVVF